MDRGAIWATVHNKVAKELDTTEQLNKKKQLINVNKL